MKIAISEFIWCPNDVCHARFKDFNGNVRLEWMSNTVGPAMPINVCLKKGCSCEALENRIEEMYGDQGKAAT